MPNSLRDVPADAVELIKSFEGIPDGDPATVNIDAYRCPAGVWTIGWGHAIVDNGQQLKGAANLLRARALYPGGITRAQAQALLAADLIPRAASTLSLVRAALSDPQFGALIAFVFNVGVANFGASTLLRKLNAGDVAGAADQFLAWDKAQVGGVLKSLAGLTRRRKAERALFLAQDWRAVAATRSRAAPEVLPVPEMPAADAAALLTPSAFEPITQIAPIEPVPPISSIEPIEPIKRRGRTTTPTAPRPAPTAARPRPRTAR
ncbi:MAG: glycoside hydrolase family protein [Rubrivivax sp.]|nr:glycoside hydrolase family protein [Rubrivivax sp.]